MHFPDDSDFDDDDPTDEEIEEFHRTQERKKWFLSQVPELQTHLCVEDDVGDDASGWSQ